MKFAIHLSTLQKDWSDDLIPLVKTAAEIGYKGVEIPIQNPDEFDIKSMKKALVENNMEALLGTGLSKNADISSTDKIIRQAGINHLRKCIDIASELNCKQLNGVTYSPWGLLKSKKEGEQNIKNSIESLKVVADYAKGHDVTIGLEILNRYEGYMINTVKEGLKFIRLVDKDNVGLHFDTFHANIEEIDMYNAITVGKEHIVFVHFCENNRGTIGSGQIDWERVASALKDINYDGWISIENFVNTNCEIGNDTKIWRQIEKNGYVAAVQGYKKLKELME